MSRPTSEAALQAAKVLARWRGKPVWPMNEDELEALSVLEAFAGLTEKEVLDLAGAADPKR